jgi:hypothetical protein
MFIVSKLIQMCYSTMFHKETDFQPNFFSIIFYIRFIIGDLGAYYANICVNINTEYNCTTVQLCKLYAHWIGAIQLQQSFSLY